MELPSIDILVLNAGMGGMGGPTQRSINGFEKIFAVNHLSHYYLAELLLPIMSKNGRIIITTSDTHDPELWPMAGGPKSLDTDDLNAVANGTSGKNGMQLYTFSKACNLCTARYLAEMNAQCKKENIRVIAYNPGGVLGTGLARDLPLTQRFLLENIGYYLMKGIGFFNYSFLPGDVGTAGKALADLALGNILPPEDQIYVSLVKGELEF